MNVIDKAGSHLKSNVADFDRFRLRRFVEGLAPDELDSGHTPALSHPKELARLLEVYQAGVAAWIA